MLDITGRKEKEEELARRTAELARSNAELEQFAYVASHDLQEPLRMVSSYTQLLARRYSGKLDSDADEFIAFAVDGAARMSRLINDLLNYSRVGSRKCEFCPASADAALDTALANVRAAIEESGAVIRRSPLPTVDADPAQLIQIFQNLLGNAIKFRNGARPEIGVACEEAPAEWRFSVSDNGIGIDPKHAGRIFQVFQRLHNKKEYPGTGIGLAICKKIAERHGGVIWVASEPGFGATFHFTIRKKKEDAR
jgi:light-regulated signal transduction histidine kinase (bacteriophytochrome)